MRLNQDCVPATFEHAVRLVMAALELREVAELREGFASGTLAAAAANSWFGAYLRRAWSVWSEPLTPLRLDVRNLTGLAHPDDVITLVLRAATAALRDEPFDLDAEADPFRIRRAELGCLPDGTPFSH